MKTRRLGRYVFWLAALVAALVPAFWFLWPEESTNATRYRWVRIGMHEDEVARIMGSPGTKWNGTFEERPREPRPPVKAPTDVIHFTPPPDKIPYWEQEGNYD